MLIVFANVDGFVRSIMLSVNPSVYSRLIAWENLNGSLSVDLDSASLSQCAEKSRLELCPSYDPVLLPNVFEIDEISL